MNKSKEISDKNEKINEKISISEKNRENKKKYNENDRISDN